MYRARIDELIRNTRRITVEMIAAKRVLLQHDLVSLKSCVGRSYLILYTAQTLLHRIFTCLDHFKTPLMEKDFPISRKLRKRFKGGCRIHRKDSFPTELASYKED